MEPIKVKAKFPSPGMQKKPPSREMSADKSGSGEPIIVKHQMGKVMPSKKPMSDPPEALGKEHVKTKKIKR